MNVEKETRVAWRRELASKVLGGVASLSLFLSSLVAFGDAAVKWAVTQSGTTGNVVRPAGAAMGTDDRLYTASSVVSRSDAGIEIACVALDGSTVWTAIYESIGSVAYAGAICARDDGRVYVTGGIQEGVRNDPFFSREFLVLCYDSDGTLLWKATPGFEGQLNLAAVMPDGGVVVSGRCNPGVTCAYNTVTLRYDATGSLIWRRVWDGPLALDDDPEGIAVDEQGNIYLTGIADQGFSSCGDDEEDCPANLYTLSYSPQGQVRWVRFEGAGYSSGTAITRLPADSTDPRGDPPRVYVAGFVEPVPRGFGYIVASYDERDGTLLWKNQFQPPNDDRPQAILVRKDGTVYVAGEYMAAFDPQGNARWNAPLPFRAIGLSELSGGTIVAAGTLRPRDGSPDNVGLIAFDSTGDITWERDYDGQDPPDVNATTEHRRRGFQIGTWAGLRPRTVESSTREVTETTSPLLRTRAWARSCGIGDSTVDESIAGTGLLWVRMGLFTSRGTLNVRGTHGTPNSLSSRLVRRELSSGSRRLAARAATSAATLS